MCHARQSNDASGIGQVVENPVYSFDRYLAAIYKVDGCEP
jgi:hypothetical protein